MGIEVKEIPDVARILIIDKLNEDGKLETMPEAWILALDSKPVAEWPPEMLEALKDYLPMQTQD